MKSFGVKVCSVLLGIAGLMQFGALITGKMLLGFVMVGSFILGAVLFCTAYGIWFQRSWGRTLGIILGLLHLGFGGIMGIARLFYDRVFSVDLLLAIFGLVILYVLLFSTRTKDAFKTSGM